MANKKIMIALPVILAAALVAVFIIAYPKGYKLTELTFKTEQKALNFDKLPFDASVGGADSTYFSLDNKELILAGGYNVFNERSFEPSGVYFFESGEKLTVYYYNFSQSDSTLRNEENIEYIDRIYISENSTVLYQFYQISSHVLLLEMYNGENGLAFDIYEFGASHFPGDVNLIYSDSCDNFPYLNICNLSGNSVFEDTIILNYNQSQNKSKLVLLDRNTGLHKNIADSDYIVMNGRTVGEKIVYAGGYGEYIYYQLLDYEGRDNIAGTAEHPRESYIYRFDIHTSEKKLIMKHNSVLIHLSGNENLLLLSEYDYFEPRYASGKIYNISNKDFDFIFENIESGNDIMDSYFFDSDHFIFLTPSDFYSVSAADKQIEHLNWEEFDTRGKIVFCEPGFVYLCVDNSGEYIVNFVTYD